MCGWCLEGIALDLLEKELRGIFPSKEIREGCGIEPSFYLREASDFPAAFERLKRSLVLRRIVPLEKLPAEIILLRAMEILLTHGFRSNVYQRLVRQDLFRSLITRACGKELRQEFIFATESLGAESLAVLYAADTFLDEKSSVALAKVARMLPSCKKLLGHYYSWWLKGDGLRKNDLHQLMEETGIMDPLDDIAEDQHGRFRLLLRAIYFGVLVAGKYRAGSNILLKLAQSDPSGVPLFEGNDLWLQRVAALKLYDQVGIEGFLEHFPVLRATHFYYINLVRGFTAEEKELVRDKYFKHPESRRNDDFVTIDEVLAVTSPLGQN